MYWVTQLNQKDSTVSCMSQYHVCFIGSIHRNLSCLAKAVSDVSATSCHVPGHCYCLHFPTCWCIALRAGNSSLYHCCSVYLGKTLGRHGALIHRYPSLVLGAYPLVHSVPVQVLFVTSSISVLFFYKWVSGVRDPVHP